MQILSPMPTNRHHAIEGRTLIIVQKSHQAIYWADLLSCSVADLLTAIKTVGNDALKIVRYLDQVEQAAIA